MAFCIFIDCFKKSPFTTTFRFVRKQVLKHKQLTSLGGNVSTSVHTYISCICKIIIFHIKEGFAKLFEVSQKYTYYIRTVLSKNYISFFAFSLVRFKLKTALMIMSQEIMPVKVLVLILQHATAYGTVTFCSEKSTKYRLLNIVLRNMHFKYFH